MTTEQQVSRCSKPHLHESDCACGYLYEIERLTHRCKHYEQGWIEANALIERLAAAAGRMPPRRNLQAPDRSGLKCRFGEPNCPCASMPGRS
jgi:hypothetical protein